MPAPSLHLPWLLLQTDCKGVLSISRGYSRSYFKEHFKADELWCLP